MSPRLITAMLALYCCAFASHAQSPEFQDGYRKGFQDGYRDGLEQGRREAASRPAAPAATPAPAAAPAPAPVPAPAPAATPAAPAQPAIVILRAVYGDLFRQCDAAGYVVKQIANRASVSFRVTNEMCGDPAPGRRKELKVTYRCGTVLRDATESEHQDMVLDCSR